MRNRGPGRAPRRRCAGPTRTEPQRRRRTTQPIRPRDGEDAEHAPEAERRLLLDGRGDVGGHLALSDGDRDQHGLHAFGARHRDFQRSVVAPGRGQGLHDAPVERRAAAGHHRLVGRVQRLAEGRAELGRRATAGDLLQLRRQAAAGARVHVVGVEAGVDVGDRRRHALEARLHHHLAARAGIGRQRDDAVGDPDRPRGIQPRHRDRGVRARAGRQWHVEHGGGQRAGARERAGEQDEHGEGRATERGGHRFLPGAPSGRGISAGAPTWRQAGPGAARGTRGSMMRNHSGGHSASTNIEA